MVQHKIVRTWLDSPAPQRGEAMSFDEGPSDGIAAVNGQVLVPAGGQLKVPVPRGGSAGFLG
jgi:hypothetical protein